MKIIGRKKNIPTYLITLLIVLFVYSIYSGFNKIEEKSTYESAHKYMHFTIKSSSLIHELQKERGYSSGLSTSSDKTLLKELKNQRLKTDYKIKVLNKFLKNFDTSIYKFAFKIDIEKLLSSLKQINKHRSSVDANELVSADVMKYYTLNISILLKLIEHIVYISHDSELSLLTQSYITLIKTKEKAGIERALINRVFSQEELSNKEFYKFGGLVEAQKIYIKYFKTIATKKHIDMFNEVMYKDTKNELTKERNIVYNKSKKNEILSFIKEDVGYGGLIHNFKNYVIRGKKKYEQGVKNQYAQLLVAIEKYKMIKGITKYELDKLKIIKDVFLKYRNGLEEIGKSYKHGGSVFALDKIVKVDDRPAIKALYELSRHIYGSQSNWFMHSTYRINSLKKIEDSISEDINTMIDSKNEYLLIALVTQFVILIVVLIIIFLLVEMLRELIESEKILNMAQINTKSGSYEYYIKEDLLIWSDEHYHLLGVDKKTFNPTLRTFDIFIHPDDRDIVSNGMELATTEPRISFFDYRVILYDNSIKYVRSSAEVIKYTASGEPLIIVGTIADVSHYKHLEEEIVNTQKDVIFTMGAIGETRSKETGQHVKRVAEYSKLLYQLTGASDYDIKMLKMASPMHDIGKVGIPDNILNKPGKLTPDEWVIMQTHSEMGYDMLKNSKREILQLAASIALTHHEKYDGSGYPKGLIANEIPMVGRITALADVFDALGSDRCYKSAWDLDKILSLVKSERAKHFDPQLVDLFIDNLDKFLEIRDKYKDTFKG